MPKSKIGGALLWGGLLMALAAQGNAAQLKSGARSEKSSVVKSDQRFLVEAAMGSLAEVNLGQLGLDRAQSQDVKKFAQRLMDDHGKSLAQMQALADKQEIKMPEQVDEKHNQVFAKLSRVGGKEFDQTFVREMIKDHEANVRAFEKESLSVNNPQIKAWAQETLPVLREHLQSAQDLSKQLAQTKARSS